MQSCSKGAEEALERHLHGKRWPEAAFTERILALQFIWRGSVLVDASASDPGSGLSPAGLFPMENEPYMPLTWGEPLSDEAQEALWVRIISDFERETRILKVTGASKRYRKTPQQLRDLRSLIGLWAQTSAFRLSALLALLRPSTSGFEP